MLFALNPKSENREHLYSICPPQTIPIREPLRFRYVEHKGAGSTTNPMRRDLDLIRRILLAFEDEKPESLTGENKELVCYHIQLLLDAEYVQGMVIWDRETKPQGYVVQRVTMSGYDYLDSVRDPKVWKETKSLVEKVGGSAALEFVKEMAAKVMTELIKSSGGG